MPLRLFRSFRPFEGEMLDVARSLSALEDLERRTQDSTLCRRIVDIAERAPEGMLDGGDAGHAH